jgi:hypothetical protein
LSRSTIAAVEQTAGLQAVNQLDVPAGHDVALFIDAFRPVFEKVSAWRAISSSRWLPQVRPGLRCPPRLRDRQRHGPRPPQRFPRRSCEDHEARPQSPRPPASKIPPDVRKAAKAAAKAASAAIIATARANTGVTKPQSQPPTTGDPTQNRDFKAGRDL